MFEDNPSNMTDTLKVEKFVGLLMGKNSCFDISSCFSLSAEFLYPIESMYGIFTCI